MESTGTLPGRLGGPLVGKAPVLHGGARRQRRPRVQTGSRGSRGRGEALLYSPTPPPLVPMRTMEECAMACRKLSIYSTLCRAGRSSLFFSFLGALAKRGHDKRGDDGTSRCGRWIGRAVGMSNGFLRDLYVLYVLYSLSVRALRGTGFPRLCLVLQPNAGNPPSLFACMEE